MTEEKNEYVSKSEVEAMILAERRLTAGHMNEIRRRNVPDFISSQIASKSACLDRIESNIKKVEVSVNQIEVKIPNMKDNVLMVDTKITQLENKIAVMQKDKVSQVPYIEDTHLKAIYNKCDGLTHAVVAEKLNMGVQNVGLYLNDKNKSQEGRRKIYKFLEDHINATV